MYALVQNNAVVQVGLPKSTQRVSNYDLSSEQVLRANGWLPYTEDIPEYDETQIAVFDEYEILADSVIGHYTIAAIPPTIESRLESAENVIMDIMMLMM